MIAQFPANRKQNPRCTTAGDSNRCYPPQPIQYKYTMYNENDHHFVDIPLLTIHEDRTVVRRRMLQFFGVFVMQFDEEDPTCGKDRIGFSIMTMSNPYSNPCVSRRGENSCDKRSAGNDQRWAEGIFREVFFCPTRNDTYGIRVVLFANDFISLENFIKNENKPNREMSRSGRHIRSSEKSENQIHLEKNENKLDRYPSWNWRQFQSAEAEGNPETSASQIQPFRARKNYNEDRQRSSRGGSQRVSSAVSSQANQRQGRTRTYGNFNTVSNESNDNRYAWLEELSEKDAPDVAKILTNERSKFENILRQSLPPKLLGIVLKVMSKFCATDFEENKVSLLSQACKHNFLDQLSQYIALIPLQGRKEEIQEISRFLEDIVTFTETIMSHLPTQAQECFDRIFTVAGFMIEYYEGHHSANFSEEVKMRFEKLKTLHAASKTEVKEKKIDGVEKGNDGRGVRRKYERKEKRDKSSELPPNEFRVMSLFPTPHELVTNESAFIRPNIIDGAYDSVEHYLDVQFRLLREDFMAPLKDGISKYVNSVNKEDVKKIDNIRIHHNVKFIKPKATREHLGVVVCFDPNNKCRDIKWDISKRFMFGSLLLFTRDNFTNIIFATVVARDEGELKKGNIVVKLEGTDVTNDIFNYMFLMAESEVYFEPYFHVMKALKDMWEFTFPMEQYIIRVETSQQLPQYARGDTIIEINNKKISILDDKSWPDAQELQFDASQYNAFKAALTKEFVIIQGPPGTGKTFLGLKIAKTLLQNSELWHSYSEDIRYYDSEDDEEIEVIHSSSSSCPMLVISLTNHALDQFLEGLDPMTINMVRIGGQSKSEILKDINLREIRIWEAGTVQLSRVANYVLKCMMLSTKRIQCDMEAISSHRGIVSVFVLRNEGILGHHFHNFEHGGSAGAEALFLEWLECGKYDDAHDALPYDAEEFMNKAYQARDNKLYAECSELQSYLMNTNISWSLIERAISVNYDLYDNCYNKYNQRIWDDLMSLKRLPSRFEAMLIELYVMKNRNYYPIVTLALGLDELDNKIRKNKILISLYEKYQQNPNLVYKIQALEEENEELKLRSSYIKRQLFYYDGVPDESIVEELLQQEDLWQLQADERWIIYRYWMHMLRRNLLLKMEEWQKDLQTAYHIKDEVQGYNDLQALKNSKVVGMTTTGAARHQKLLQDLKPKIVFVEEAAEVMESHIVVSLTDSCEHVILIGDHQQLRPSPAVYELAIKYNFDISLFERMLKNNMQCSVLKVQHRMRPEIAQLITPTIYPELENHSSVTEFESIHGVLKSVFFITHEHPEDQSLMLAGSEFQSLGRAIVKEDEYEEVTEASSHRNKHEAEFLIALGCYLIHQGYQPSQITILTTYSGQMYHLLNEQKNYEMLKDVQITTVDNFQGEENDIILLSLVRSNTEAKIGFLKVENRVCVALSRAKKGLYIMGNMENLTRSSKIWPKIKETLQKQDGYGLYLTLRCQIHPSQFTKYKCMNPCTKRRKNCNENHTCKNLCHEECLECKASVLRKLPKCGHEVRMQCSADVGTHPCDRDCTSTLSCGHPCPNKCSAPCGNCQVSVEKLLVGCEHYVQVKCCEIPDPSQCKSPYECRNQKKLLAFCRTPCYSVLECGHKCSGTCGKCFQGRVHKPCKEKCEATLLCGHRQFIFKINIAYQECISGLAGPRNHVTGLASISAAERSASNYVTEDLATSLVISFFHAIIPALVSVVKHVHLFAGYAKDRKILKQQLNLLQEDCGHTVRAEILDELVPQAKHQIGMLVCPDCSCSIITTARYRNNAKTFFQDISHVKSIMLRNVERKTPKEISFSHFNILIDDDYDFDDDEYAFHLFKQLRYHPKLIKGSFTEQLKLFYKKLQAAEEHIEKNLLDMLLKILEQVTTSLSNVCLNRHRTSINEVVRHTKFLLHVMGRQEVYSTQVVDDFNLEIQRLHTLCKLFSFMNGKLVQPHSTNPEVQKYYAEAQSIILSLERYSEQEHGKALNVIQSIKNTVVELTVRYLAEQNLEKVEKFTGDIENFVVELEKKEEALTTEWTSCREKLTKFLADEEKEPMEVDNVIMKWDVEMVESVNTLLQAFDLDSMPQIKKFKEALENSKKIVMNLKDKEYKLSTKVKEMLNEVRNLRNVINKLTDAERKENMKTHYLQLKEVLIKFAELMRKTSSSESIKLSTLQTYLRGMKDLADFQRKEHFIRDEKVKPLEYILYHFKQGSWYKCPRSHIYATYQYMMDFKCIHKCESPGALGMVAVVAIQQNLDDLTTYPSHQNNEGVNSRNCLMVEISCYSK
ncbi:hypothetical protein ANN_18655 [Periplaneta americana]|uniref:NFX1-type zinc finger-containing protein 1 n=1 Tax=Periplaneta americana TaxID=6978 RepID=A0ABQ8SPC6_PERAM|nr:hypothetical protein ANN_18655 [Periplaneta americana]